MQMKALARLKDWEGLETFAREKKSPIGLNPFIATAKDAGAPEATLSRYHSEPCSSAKAPHSKALHHP